MELFFSCFFSWTLSGREAEALHFEEEDDDEKEDEDPLQKLLKSKILKHVIKSGIFIERKT